MAQKAMSMDRMKAIDHYVGIPVCWVLGSLAACVPFLRGHRGLPLNPKRILIIKFFGMGHVLMATPLLKAIREGYPNAHLIFMTFDSTAPLVTRLGLADEVRLLRTTGLVPFGVDLMRHSFRFLTERIDVVIDLEFFSKFSTMVSMLTRSRVRVGYYLETFWRDSIITHPIFFNYHQHVLDIYESTANAIGLPMADRAIRPLHSSVDERAGAVTFLATSGIVESDVLVGVNVHASELSFERRWPADRFVELIDRLLATQPVKVLLTGAPTEAEYTETVYQQLAPRWSTRLINGCGRLSFGEFVALLGRCSVYVTGDSGPMHVSIAQGVPTVSLWGPTNPNFHAPQDGRSRVIYHRMPCSPCLPMLTSRPGMWCNHRADCMQRITVDEVLQVVGEMLREYGGRMAQPADPAAVG